MLIAANLLHTSARKDKSSSFNRSITVICSSPAYVFLPLLALQYEKTSSVILQAPFALYQLIFHRYKVNTGMPRKQVLKHQP